jgi:branched-chain amino acid transport system substrate-binding protein
MKSSRLFLAATVAAATMASAAWSEARAAAVCSDPIQIALTTPITTDIALLGIQARNGLQLAVDDLNATGGIAGKKIKLDIADTSNSATTAINALNRLLDAQPLVVYSSMISPQVFAQSDIVRKAQIPFLVAATNAKITDQGIPWLFRMHVHDGQLAEFAPRYVVETMKAKRPAIIAVADDFGLGASKGIQQTLAKLNVTPVAVESYAPSDKDMTAQLLNIADKKADVILMWGRPGDITLVLKQMKQLGIDIPRVGNASVVAQTTLNNLTAEEADGAIAIGGLIPQGVDSAPAKAIVAKAIEQFNVPADNFTVAYYDSLHLLKTIIEKVGCDQAAIREALATTKNWRGMLIAYTADTKGDLAHTVGVYQNKGKTPTLISTLTEAGF